MSSTLQVNPGVLGIRPPTSLGETKLFSTVTDLSSADLQRTGMPPLSFARQVLAVCLYPELVENNTLPLDVKQRAQTLLSSCDGGSVGSYPPTNGIPEVLKSVVEFIRRRDGGVMSHPDDIICCTGSQHALQLDWLRPHTPIYGKRRKYFLSWRHVPEQSCLIVGGVKGEEPTLILVLHLMSSGAGRTQTGVLTPAPCPHTLPMLLDETGVKQVAYRLAEERGWAVDLDELHRALQAARGHCEPRAIYISNPGNPTGHVQDRKTMEEIIRFAANEHLVLLAEEVYQDSVYGPDEEFLSYKKVLLEMDAKYSETVELISFHSISSVCMGDGGLRGGYMEMTNLDPEVKRFYKRTMMNLCRTAVLGQVALEVMVNPPAPGDPSYRKYTQEILRRKETLTHNARRACDFLNRLRGMSCQPAMAGVFLYPRLLLPPRMIEDAKRLGVTPDLLYCRWLLEEEGLRLGPGCDNGQEEDHFHIRLCVLAPAAALDDVLARIASFHQRLLDRY